MNGTLYRRLLNWGDWLNWEAEIIPNGPKCRSMESRSLRDAGDIWEPDDPRVVPDVTDAEVINGLVRNLGVPEQYALAVRYGGMQCVMRFRRIGDAAQEKLANNAETLLMEMIREGLD